MACARWFLKQAPNLAEMFHSPLGLWVKNGKTYPLSQLDAHDVALHYNHVHIAVNKGTLLQIPASVPTAAQPTTQGDDGMADALVIEYASGAKTIATPDGSIFNAGTPFYGSMNDLTASQKQGVTSIKAITAENPNDPAAGYKLWAQNGNGYDFTPAFWKSKGH